MVVVTIHSDFRAQEEEICHTSTFSPSICQAVIGRDTMILVFFFLIFHFKAALSLSSFTFIKRLFSYSLLSAIRVVSSAFLRLLMFLPFVLIPACNSSSSAFFHDVLSLQVKQGDSTQACHIPFSVLNQSVVPYRVLTVASWPEYRFFRRQVRCSGIHISPRASHSLSWSTQKF